MEEVVNLDEGIKELINRRRRQILVHSCIYYRFNTSIISDKDFDIWSYELVALQELYPDIAAECVYAKEFKGFDGTTGFNLPLYGGVLAKAQQLIKIHREMSQDNVANNNKEMGK